MQSIQILSQVSFNKIKLMEKSSMLDCTDSDTLSMILKHITRVEINSKIFAVQTNQVLSTGSISDLLTYTSMSVKKLDEIKALKEKIVINLNYLNTKYVGEFNFYYIPKGLDKVIELWLSTIECIVESRTSRFEKEC